MSDRLWRLVGGEGDTTAERGGGFDAQTLFMILGQMALDHGEIVFEEGVAAVEQHYRFANEGKRIRTLYGAKGPYDRLTADGLDQLVETGFLRRTDSDDRWLPTDHLAPGERLVVVPGKGRSEVTITIYPAEVREWRQSLDDGRAATLASQLAPEGNGLRPVDPARVEELAESMRQHDFLSAFAVLVDQYGRILGGRHRLAAAKVVGVEPVKRTVTVDSDEEAVIVAVLDNQLKPWASRELKQLSERTAGLGPKIRREMQRRWTEWEIRTTQKTAQEIAQTVGFSDQTVHKIWRELRAQDSKLRADTPSTKRISECITAELDRDPSRSDEEIAEATGGKPSTVRTARRARARKAKAAADEPVPSQPGGPSASRSWESNTKLIGAVSERLLDGTFHRKELADEFEVGTGTVDEVRGFVLGRRQSPPDEPEPTLPPELVAEPEVVRVILAGTPQQVVDQVFEAASATFWAEFVDCVLARKVSARESAQNDQEVSS